MGILTTKVWDRLIESIPYPATRPQNLVDLSLSNDERTIALDLQRTSLLKGNQKCTGYHLTSSSE